MDLQTREATDIEAVLRQKFVYSERVARILTIALRSNQNVLLWGPAGHGKSEMVQAVLTHAGNGKSAFTLSFGEGMTEDRLWGGLDVTSFTQGELRYMVEHSFLPHERVVFEEFLDAPPNVLQALKDAVSARELRKGNQTFRMNTEIIVAITNKDPREMSALGPAAHAVMERFPLQLRVEWPSYTPADYLMLFELIEQQLEGPPVGNMGVYLAELLSGSGEIVSPRLARHALTIVKTAAALRHGDSVEKIDFVDLQYLPGMSASARSIQGDLDALIERKNAERRIQEAERVFQEIVQNMVDALRAMDAHALLNISGQFRQFGDTLSGLRVTDEFTTRRAELRSKTEQYREDTLEKASQYVR